MKDIREHFFSFRGRITRSRYFLLGLVVVGGALAIIIPVHFLLGPIIGAAAKLLIVFVVLIGCYISSLSLAVRRGHDFGVSGKFIIATMTALLILELVAEGVAAAEFSRFISFINAVFMFVVWLKKGQEGDNQFGPDPLAKTT